jgi:hypothetical protein
MRWLLGVPCWLLSVRFSETPGHYCEWVNNGNIQQRTRNIQRRTNERAALDVGRSLLAVGCSIAETQGHYAFRVASEALPAYSYTHSYTPISPALDVHNRTLFIAYPRGAAVLCFAASREMPPARFAIGRVRLGFASKGKETRLFTEVRFLRASR